jgi:hypothetical protein
MMTITMMMLVLAMMTIIVTTPTTVLAQQKGEIFEGEDGTFRVQVPQGRVAQDISQEEVYAPARELGWDFLVTMYQEEIPATLIGFSQNESYSIINV